MARPFALALVTLALTHNACSTSPDAAIFSATLNDFYTKGPGPGSFPPGSTFLVHPMSQTWTIEDASVLEANASDGGCLSDDSIYRAITARNSDPADLSRMIAPQKRWRVATRRELEAIENTFLPKQFGDDFVFSFGSLSMPAYSKDGDAAYVLLNFSWGEHGGYGEYVLTKDESRWIVQCRSVHNYL